VSRSVLWEPEGEIPSGDPAGNVRLRDLPRTYNIVYAAFATGDGRKGGAVTYDPSPVEARSAFAVDVSDAHARGQKVLLSIGGANDQGIHVTNGRQVGQMASSVSAIVNTYGFDGIDWDLENDVTWNIQSVTAVSNKLKKTYGKCFLISVAPAPDDVQWKIWASRMGRALDLFGMQFYEYPSTDAQRIGAIVSRTNEMIKKYRVPARKLMIGAMTTGGQCRTCTSSPRTYLRAFNKVHTQHPGIRGTYVWDSVLDKSTGWSFATVAGDAVRRLPRSIVD